MKPKHLFSAIVTVGLGPAVVLGLSFGPETEVPVTTPPARALLGGPEVNVVTPRPSVATKTPHARVPRVKSSPTRAVKIKVKASESPGKPQLLVVVEPTEVDTRPTQAAGGAVVVEAPLPQSTPDNDKTPKPEKTKRS